MIRFYQPNLDFGKHEKYYTFVSGSGDSLALLKLVYDERIFWELSVAREEWGAQVVEAARSQFMSEPIAST